MHTEPDHSVYFRDPITNYAICANDFAYNLICVAMRKRLCLILVNLPEETGEFVWNNVQELEISDIDRHCNALCFSPDTSLNCTPNKVTICVAIGLCELKLVHSDLNQYNRIQSLKGHTDYINDVAWVCDGELLASVSDDFTCKFWNVSTNLENIITFCLSSAGMAVKSHPEDPNKVLVAEKRGIIHLYNVRSKQAIVSVEAPKFPLMSADWSNGNRLLVAALSGGDIVTWDLSRPFVPADVKQVHEDGGRAVQFAPGSSDIMVASIGRPDITLKVFAPKSAVPLVEYGLKTYGGLAWHQRLPYITAASDRKLYFWKVQVK
ncbi:nucleoporin Nup37 [Scaptodrosophila lebanonensis]|uniref:Nucleoporin Nup37 n=1 Tax=Drosophila lebanonensis TaxID=7225 RepID=A0A6J2TCQ4_DROLE|nr:nucleoporin Nup37 [Scaptodrosophila lebanonensis]